MGKTVGQLLAEVSSPELTEWMAYYRIEPFGEMVADQRHGIATAVLANVNRDPKRTPEPYTFSDFVPWRENQTDKGTPVLLSDPEAQSKLIKSKFAMLQTS